MTLTTDTTQTLMDKSDSGSATRLMVELVPKKKKSVRQSKLNIRAQSPNRGLKTWQIQQSTVSLVFGCRMIRKQTVIVAKPCNYSVAWCTQRRCKALKQLKTGVSILFLVNLDTIHHNFILVHVSRNRKSVTSLGPKVSEFNILGFMRHWTTFTEWTVNTLLYSRSPVTHPQVAGTRLAKCTTKQQLFVCRLNKPDIIRYFVSLNFGQGTALFPVLMLKLAFFNLI